MIEDKKIVNIRAITKALIDLYPIIGMNESRSSLYGTACMDGIITEREYYVARMYYGGLWNYTGD